MESTKGSLLRVTEGRGSRQKNGDGPVDRHRVKETFGLKDSGRCSKTVNGDGVGDGDGESPVVFSL